MKFAHTDHITVEIPRAAIEVVFDECDRYNVDETGGRIVGTFKRSGRSLHISVNGIIEPGPNAQRTRTYFKQDGEYQEQVFREVEEHYPSIEHLGNWHTHHVNGYPRLSDGDIGTYHRIVNHKLHNTDFFYALLVTEKQQGQTGLQRYVFKNYLMQRDDDRVYEIPAHAVNIVDGPLVWPQREERARRHKPESSKKSAAVSDAYKRSEENVVSSDLLQDQQEISQFWPKLKMLQSKELGIFWRGHITLADGSELEAVVLRDREAPFDYSVTLREPDERLLPAVEALGKATFRSGRAALLAAERACNAQLLSSGSSKRKRWRSWMF